MTGDTPLQASLSPRQVLVWDGGEEEGGWKRQEMTAPDPELHLLSGSAPADEVTPLRARDLSDQQPPTAKDGAGHRPGDTLGMKTSVRRSFFLIGSEGCALRGGRGQPAGTELSPCWLCRSFSLEQSSSTKVSMPELCRDRNAQ